MEELGGELEGLIILKKSELAETDTVVTAERFGKFRIISIDLGLLNIRHS